MASSGDILETIAKRRALDVESSKQETDTCALACRTAASYAALPVDLYQKLTACLDRFFVAAEFKRASPSKGSFVDAQVAVSDNVHAYIAGGADMISVLTEPHWFQGSLQDMESARSVADSSAGADRVLILRKEFVVDAFQIHEARAYGADSVLLIVSLLPTEAELRPLIDCARGLGMEPLVEVNSVAEMTVALAAGSRVVGINNRNLRTFTVDMGTTTRVVQYAAQEYARQVAAGIPNEPVAILSLSGLKSGEDVTSLALEIGACTPLMHPNGLPLGLHLMRGFLVGEALMRAADPAAMVTELRAAGQSAIAVARAGLLHSSSLSQGLATEPAVKICGLRTVEAAMHAARAGADLCGIIMVPNTPRSVSAETASSITAALRAYREADPRTLLLDAIRVESTARGGMVDAGRICRSTQLLRSASRRARPLSVGVFMDQDAPTVSASATAAQVDVVQLHGNEDPQAFSAAAGFPFPVIKVLHITVGGDSASFAAELASVALRAVAWSRVAVALLFDSKAVSGGASGGTGAAFDHAAVLPQLAAALAVDAGSTALFPFVLAGGLTPSTVANAVHAARQAESQCKGGAGVVPHVWAADVSSGVELEPGKVLADGSCVGKGVKDPAKVEAFVRAAGQALA